MKATDEKHYVARRRLTFCEALKAAFTGWGGPKNPRRVRRSEYWQCMLAIVIYYAIFFALRYLLEDVMGWNVSGWLGVIIFTLFSVIPVGLWVMENYGRLHDTNHRDTWLQGFIAPLLLGTIALPFMSKPIGTIQSPSDGILIGASGVLFLIAAVFAVICFVFCLKDSDKGENDYGPSPKYTTIEPENDYLEEE